MKRKLKITAAFLAAIMMVVPTEYAFAAGLPTTDVAEEEEFIDESLVFDEEENNTEDKKEDKKTQEEEKQQSVNISDDVSVLLDSLGIMSDTELSLDSVITRSFAAEVLVRMAGLAVDEPISGGTMYSDVDAENPYGYSIETATKLGYFKGGDDGLFEPDRTITTEEAVVVLLRFAGYDGKVRIRSEYSSIYKNVPAGEMTYKSFANLIYNVLDLGTVMIEGANDESGLSYRIDSETTILNSVFSVYRLSGIIYDNESTGLNSKSRVGIGEIYITSKGKNYIVGVGTTDVALAIGRNVNLYYKQLKGSDESVCICYSFSSTKNNEKKISFNDIDFGASNYTTVYSYENGKEKKLKCDSDLSVIYNGTYYTKSEFDITKLSELEGYASFVDNDGDNSYEVLDIEAYEVYVVKNVVLSNNKITPKNSGREPIILDDYDKVELTNEGIVAYLEDFVAGTIASIAKTCEGIDTKKAIVKVSTQTITGIIQSIDTNEAGYDICKMQDGSVYRIMSDTKVEAGKNVLLSITAFGNVADVAYVASEDFVFGIISQKTITEDDKLRIKILTLDNNVEEKEFAQKVYIDGTQYDDVDEIIACINSIEEYDTGISSWPTGTYPVRYKLNSNGKISNIDTPYRDTKRESGNTLRKLYAETKGSMINYVFGGIVPVISSTPIIQIYMSESDWTIEPFIDNKFTFVGKASNYVNTYKQSSATFIAYSIDENSVFADYVVIMSGSGSAKNNSSLFMIDKISSVYDEESNTVTKKLSGYLAGVYNEVVVSPKYECPDVSTGDVISYGTDEYGRLTGYYTVVQNGYKTKLLKSVKDANSNDTFSRLKEYKVTATMIYGYVLKREGDLIKIRNIPFGDNVQSIDRNVMGIEETSEGWFRIPSSTPITIYDPHKNNKVYAGTYDEITDTVDARSIVGMRYQSNDLKEIVVFNDYE